VAVPEHIQIKLLNHLRQFYPDKPESEIREMATAKVDELERTPPVPWLTQNEWPVANGDFAEYRLLLEREVFEVKRDFFNIVAGIERVKDKEELWNQIGKSIVVFSFSVVGAENIKIAVPQSLDAETIERVWG